MDRGVAGVVADVTEFDRRGVAEGQARQSQPTRAAKAGLDDARGVHRSGGHACRAAATQRGGPGHGDRARGIGVVQVKLPAADRRRAGVAIGSRERQRAGPRFGQTRTATADASANGQGAGGDGDLGRCGQRHRSGAEAQGTGTGESEVAADIDGPLPRIASFEIQNHGRTAGVVDGPSVDRQCSVVIAIQIERARGLRRGEIQRACRQGVFRHQVPCLGAGGHRRFQVHHRPGLSERSVARVEPRAGLKIERAAASKDDTLAAPVQAADAPVIAVHGETRSGGDTPRRRSQTIAIESVAAAQRNIGVGAVDHYPTITEPVSSTVRIDRERRAGEIRTNGTEGPLRPWIHSWSEGCCGRQTCRVGAP